MKRLSNFYICTMKRLAAGGVWFDFIFWVLLGFGVIGLFRHDYIKSDLHIPFWILPEAFLPAACGVMVFKFVFLCLRTGVGEEQKAPAPNPS